MASISTKTLSILPLLCPHPNSALTPTLPLPLLCQYPYSALTLPLRDGLNRLPMEFTLARNHAGKLSSSLNVTRTEGAGLANQGTVRRIHQKRIIIGKNDCDRSNSGDCSWRTDSVRSHCNFNKTILAWFLRTYITAYILSLLLFLFEWILLLDSPSLFFL